MKYGKLPIWKKIISSKITLICLFIILVVLVRAVWSISRKSSLSTTRLMQARAELAKLAERQKDLSDRIKYLSTEQGIESELRTKYRAVKEGESVAVIVDKNQSSTSSNAVVPADAIEQQDKNSWFTSLLRRAGL